MILILGFSAIGAAGADTMNCGRRIIAREVLSAEVLARCGAPDHRETWFDGAHAPFPPTEVWTYDRGPRQLIRRLRFVNGRLESIDTDGYGYPERLDGDCRPTDIVERLSSYRLYRECGEPMSRERVELLAPRRAPGRQQLDAFPTHRLPAFPVQAIAAEPLDDVGRPAVAV